MSDASRKRIRKAAERVLLLVGLSMSAIAALALLTGCAGQQTVEIPKEVRVPVPVPCVKAEDRPTRPQLRTDGEILALDDYKRTLAMWEDRRTRQAYEGELEAVVEGCSRIPEGPPPVPGLKVPR